MTISYHKHLGETCIVCEEKKERGIHIINEFICTECEQQMIQTETHEQKYRYFIEKLQKIKETKLYS
ncbi:sigma factor G inhibitor Gin [Bacillus tianshenii]|nr:sigma factor G inhibitor Gin [Bacillus tianshenii]